MNRYLILFTIVFSACAVKKIKHEKWNYIQQYEPLTHEADSLLLRARKIMPGPDNGVNVYFDIMDEKGTYYYNGADKTFLANNWKELLEVTKNGASVSQIDYTIEEINHCESLSFFLLLDYSGSMGDNISHLEKGVKGLVEQKKEKDEIAISKFSDEVLRAGNYTTSEREALKQLNKYSYKQYFAKGTNLQRALDSSFADQAVMVAQNPRHLVLFSDGYASINVVSNIINSNDWEMPISVIDFGKQKKHFGSLKKEEINKLEKVCVETGGYYIPANSIQEVQKAFEEIRKRECTSYKLFFIPKTILAKKELQLKLDLPRVTSDLTFEISGRGAGVRPITPKRKIVKDEVKPVYERTYKNKTRKVIINADTLAVEEKPSQKYAEGEIVRLEVFFDTGSDALRPESMKEIQAVYTFLQAHPKIKIELRGHTDNRGTHEYNQELSQKRCERVKSELVKMGIEESRIATKGLGEVMPVATNDTQEGMQLNRRTEMKILNVD